MPESTPRMSPATLHDVARVAGVSLATASRALNGSTRKVNDEYRRRVLDAARDLNYSPNLSAQAVARGGSSTIVLIVGDITDPYFSSIAAGVLRRAEEARLIVTIGVSGRSAARELELVQATRGQRPRAILLAGSRYVGGEFSKALSDELAVYESMGGRVVVVSQAELPFDTVLLENFEGARDLAHALVAQGCRRFGAITADNTLMTSRDRLAGFAAGLRDHGMQLDNDGVEEAEFTRDGGYEAARRLYQRDGVRGLDVIFAANDVMAIGAMTALRDAGLKLPDDISIAGFGDIATAQDVGLTTVRVPIEELGVSAVEIALTSTDKHTQSTLTTSVVLRSSTPPVDPTVNR